MVNKVTFVGFKGGHRPPGSALFLVHAVVLKVSHKNNRL